MLRAYVDGLARMPLLYQPGTQWNYSEAPNVQARLIEVLSGRPIDVFLQERLFGPLAECILEECLELLDTKDRSFVQHSVHF